MTCRLDGHEMIGSPLHIMATKPRVLASMKAAGKSRGETLYAVASAIANAGINWCVYYLSLLLPRAHLSSRRCLVLAGRSNHGGSSHTRSAPR